MDKSTIQHALNALEYTDDVIVSCWQSKEPSDKELHSQIQNIGVRVVTAEDPQSILAYEDGGISKNLNVNRQLVGTYSGVMLAKYKYTIKTRTDLSVNYKMFFDKWTRSEKPCASLNITSVAPKRFLAPPFLFHISDWCIGAATSRFLDRFSQRISEEQFERAKPCRIRGIKWYVRLSAEQILAGILTGENPTAQGQNYISAKMYQNSDWSLDKRIKSYFCNIDRAGLMFSSTKYRARANRWIMHDDCFFRDEGFIKAKPQQFLFHVISKILK